MNELEFQKGLQEYLVSSDLQISQIYWILKDTFRDIEELYRKQLYQNKLNNQEGDINA